jgi:hypothetical protein
VAAADVVLRIAGPAALARAGAFLRLPGSRGEGRAAGVLGRA